MLSKMYDHDFWECKNFFESLVITYSDYDVDIVEVDLEKIESQLSEAKYFALKLLDEVERLRNIDLVEVA